MARILVVDDERAIRNTLRDILELEGYEIDDAPDGAEALVKLQANAYDVAICDIKMPKMDGMELLSKAQELGLGTQFLVISGHGTIETAVEATRRGAFDFIEKPPDLNRLLVSLRNALDKGSLVAETRALKRRVAGVREILGQSPAIHHIRETLQRVAPTDARVLITGANGTGKELVARWLHELSTRAQAPLVEVNCAAIPSELIESELFGHEKGSFTSAVKQRIGKFEQAHGGTLFLDEIGDMSLAAQAKVLRALQEHKITRVGGEREISVNVRVVAATNKDLTQEVTEGRFREDLYHRLGVILIHVPSLAERLDDVPLLAEQFLEEVCQEYGYPTKKLDPAAAEALKQHGWTGNVRELRNVVERLTIFAGGTITATDVLQYAFPGRSAVLAANSRAAEGTPDEDYFLRHPTFQEFKDTSERDYILRKLNQHGWNVTKTAEAIDIQRSHLYNKIEKYGLKREAE